MTEPKLVPEKSGGTIKEKDKDTEEKEGLTAVPECAVCLQPCIHPARLPCSHIYCYLCVKGVANQSKQCPMCQQEIPPDFLERPQLVEVDESQKESEPEEEYQWFIEGRDGWWKFNPEINNEIEAAYKRQSCALEIYMGYFEYRLTFATMRAQRLMSDRYEDYSDFFDPTFNRLLKRDKKSAPCKGVW